MNLSPEGVAVKRGEVPDANLGIRSDNDWLIHNLEAAAKGVAGIVEQAQAGTFSRLIVRKGALDMNDALYGILRHFTDITHRHRRQCRWRRRDSGNFAATIGGSVMNGIIEWVEQPDSDSPA